jgi:hypothetical protein
VWNYGSQKLCDVFIFTSRKISDKEAGLIDQQENIFTHLNIFDENKPQSETQYLVKVH